MDTSPPNKRLKLENDNDENESTVVHKGTSNISLMAMTTFKLIIFSSSLQMKRHTGCVLT